MAIQTNTEQTIKGFEIELKQQIINMSARLTLSELRSYVYENKLKGIGLMTCHQIALNLYNDMYRFGLIQKYLDDPYINEIMINGLSNIIIEKQGELTITEDRFSSDEQLNNIIQKIVSSVNRRVNASNPIVDARLEDGSRVNIVLKPVAVNGPIVTIRKFKNNRMTLEHYAEDGLISHEAKVLLEKLIQYKYNIFVSGGTSSGKTTFLNALAEHIPITERIITIEDAAELKLPGITNLVTLETKHENLDGKGGIKMDQLIKTALRMRPDRIIVGEVRGAEALDMIHAMNTGHDGSLSTGHANSSKDMLSRLELMILSNMELPLLSVKKLLGNSIDILIHLERHINGKRYIKSINELSYDDDYNLRVLFHNDGTTLIKGEELSNRSKWLKYETV